MAILSHSNQQGLLEYLRIEDGPWATGYGTYPQNTDEVGNKQNIKAAILEIILRYSSGGERTSG
jgi:hypothetical protein